MAVVFESNVRRLTLLCCCASLCVVLAGCAPKAAPVAPGVPKHSDYVFPVVPEGTKPDQASRIDRGWQYLQLDDHRNAEIEFAAALKQQPSFVPAETAMAYLSWDPLESTCRHASLSIL